jgi:PAS domain S-box-containing protein
MSEDGVETIHVLHVDDDPEWRDIVAEFLEREHDAITVSTEKRGSDALDRLTGEPIDCILSDYEMPGMDGLELLQAVRARRPDLPFVLFTGQGSEALASDAIATGVTEYLQKASSAEQYALLANRIERAVTGQRARDALRESERMLSTLIGNLPGMVYRCKNERGWPMSFVSKGCEELTGYHPLALESGEVCWGEDILHPDDREEMWETVQASIEAGEPFEVTYRIRTRDGDLRWVWERGSGVFEDGDVAWLEGFVTDITPRKRREQELRAAREFTESALNALDDVFLVVDPERQRFLRWNDRLNERTGYDDDRLSGMCLSDLVVDADAERIERAIDRALEVGEVTVTADVVTSDGDSIPVEFRGSPLYDDAGDLIGVGAVGRIITDRRERERELERFETVVQAVGDPVYALDPDGRFTFVNEAFESMTGYATSEVLGEHVEMIITQDNLRRGREHIGDLVADDDRRAVKYEIEVVTKSGDRIPSELHMALLPADGEEFRGTAGIIRDIEERKQREKRLEEFASVVSHDLRGPLNVILGQARLAIDAPEAAELEKIVASGQRMETLIEDLLTLAQQGETVGDRTPTDLSAVVDDAWDAIETAEATLDNRTERRLRVDRDRLRELLENLVRNAVEHAGPDVTVTVGPLDDGGFYVADDGPGIPPEKRGDVFEHGYTTHEEGTGFGLAIVERIAEAHGWSVSLTESESGGTRFEFAVG